MQAKTNHCGWKNIVAVMLLATIVGSVRGAVEQDILFSYAPSYATSLGGEANAQVSFANLAVAVNGLYDQCGAGAHWHVAGYYQSVNDPVNWTTTGGMVGWLSGNNANVSDVVSYGSSVGADLVLYVVQNSDSSSIAGVTQQPGTYGVVNPGSVWSAVVAHEIGGHAYGCNHQDGHINPKTIMMHNYCGGGSAPPYYFSNPNMWWNGVRMTGDGNTSCLGGSLVNGGDNTYCLSANSQGVQDRRSRLVYAPVLNKAVLHWCFTNAPGAAAAGTTNYDLVSAAPAVVRGNGATYTGGALRIPGGTTGNVAMNSMSAYIDLPNGIISSQTNLTIEIWATPLSAPSWARIIDFGRTTEAGDGLGAAGEYTGTPGTAAPGSTSSSDGIMLSSSIGTDINQQRFEAKLNGSAVTLNSALATTAGVQHHYAITFTDGAGTNGSAGGRWQWYRDGDSVGFLDVNYHLVSIEDVDNWLGRSLWSGDANANSDYAEVRISNVAMTRGQIFANYLVGPNYFPDVTLNGTDALGTTSFNAIGNWSSGVAPLVGHKYETYDFQIRTPATTSPYTFAGDALTMSGGSLLWKGTASSTITISNLALNNALIANAGSGTFTLAGSLKITNDVTCNSINGPATISANLNGGGSLTFYANTATLTGNNTNYTGKIRVGNGISGSLAISSEAQLGDNPPTFTTDQLLLNRGWLYTTTSFTISNSNRGIQIGMNDGLINVASGTTLTLGCPVSSPAFGSGVVGGILWKQSSGTLVLTSPNNTHYGPIQIDAGTLSVSGAGVLAGGSYGSPYFLNNGIFDYSSSTAQTISSPITGSGSITKNGTGTLTLSGANTMSGSVTINGGTLYANPANAANNRALSYVSGITINNGGTLRASSNGLFGWDGTQEKPITVNAGGVLTANGGLASDVGVGSVTLAGGTLATLAGGATDYGSWRFDDASDRLLVTQNSIVSAANIKFGSPAACIAVASGKTLTFTGTITDTTSGGISYLTLSNGTGTVTLNGGNTYSGATLISGGKLLVNGSIGSSVVTVTNGGTLGGNGVIGGAVTVQSGGTLSPGSSIGVLMASNNVTLQAGGTNVMEISKTPLTNDQLRVTGTLTFGGTLVVSNLAGALAAGDRFILFQAGSINGSFTAYSLPPLAANLAWNTNNLTSGVLSVVQTTPTNLVWNVSGTNLNLSWPTGYIGWRLQVQTNSLNAGLGTNWVDVSGSSLTNNVALPVGTTLPMEFYRLLYP